MDANRKLKRYERVIRSAATKYAAKLLAQRPNEYDDVMNEARIAAWRAIERYDASQQVKIETFIFNCVRNKMFDLAKYANRLGRNLITPNDEDVEQQGEEDASLEHKILLKQVLTDDELDFIVSVRRGGGVSAFVNELSRMTGMKMGEATKEVSECLHHIQHKLKSHEQSQNILTLKRPSKPPREGTA